MDGTIHGLLAEREAFETGSASYPSGKNFGTAQGNHFATTASIRINGRNSSQAATISGSHPRN